MSHSPVLGIDLGTTFSSMALVDRFGKPVIIPNAEGHPTTPTIIHFYDRDACVVGDEALKMVVADPANIARFVKRSMGEDHFTWEFFGQSYTPQQLSAIVLRSLKQDAEEALGEPVTDAVITVPAYFDSAQRGATAEAGRIAGLNVLSIINEPTAAAVAFGLDRLGGHKRLMVFDLGGGTFDVTIMEMRGIAFRTIASDGNAELGGKDWDDRLLNHVAEEFARRTDLDPRDQPQPYQELYERSVQAKIALSTKPRVIIPVNYRGHRQIVKITRDEFEALTRDLVQQCLDTCELVLRKAKMTWDRLDEVLLVGGSTRMPMVREAMRERSGRTEAGGFNPEEGVALGAALAGVLRHRPHHPALKPQRRALAQRVKDTEAGKPVSGHLPPVRITDATSHPLGIVVFDKNHEERVITLIPEGTPLPCERRGRFAYAYDSMTAVRVEATEGHGKRREDVRVIGEVVLDKLPPRPRGTAIDVVYRYGVNQILEIDVVDVQSGHRRSATIQLRGAMPEAQLDTARANLARTHRAGTRPASTVVS